MLEVFVGVLAALLVRDAVREWLRRPLRFYNSKRAWDRQPWYDFVNRVGRVLGVR